MRGLVYMASRDKVDVDTFHKGIQYSLEKLEKSKFGFESTTVSNFKSKSHEGSGNELIDYSRAPCLGADQKARGLWERDWTRFPPGGKGWLQGKKRASMFLRWINQSYNPWFQNWSSIPNQCHLIFSEMVDSQNRDELDEDEEQGDRDYWQWGILY